MVFHANAEIVEIFAEIAITSAEITNTVVIIQTIGKEIFRLIHQEIRIIQGSPIVTTTAVEDNEETHTMSGVCNRETTEVPRAQVKAWET